jgi:hypothetical protein
MSKTPTDGFDIVISVIGLPVQSAFPKPSTPDGSAMFGVLVVHADRLRVKVVASRGGIVSRGGF